MGCLVQVPGPTCACLCFLAPPGVCDPGLYLIALVAGVTLHAPANHVLLHPILTDCPHILPTPQDHAASTFVP